jgi:hypothetical protein
MQTIRVLTTLESESLTLPQLRPLIGKQVEITVCEAPAGNGSNRPPPAAGTERRPLLGSVIRYDDPLSPVASDDEWESAT